MKIETGKSELAKFKAVLSIAGDRPAGELTTEVRDTIADDLALLDPKAREEHPPGEAIGRIIGLISTHYYEN